MQKIFLCCFSSYQPFILVSFLKDSELVVIMMSAEKYAIIIKPYPFILSVELGFHL